MSKRRSTYSSSTVKVDLEVVRNYITAAFSGGWFIMVVVGALGHQLHIPRLFIGYWTAVLIEILAEYLFSPGSTVGPYYRQIIRLMERPTEVNIDMPEINLKLTDKE